MASSALNLFIRASDALIKFDAKFGALKQEELNLFSLEIHSVEIKKLWERVVGTYEDLLKNADSSETAKEDVVVAEGKYDSSYDAYVRCLGSINEKLQGLGHGRKSEERTPARSSVRNYVGDVEEQSPTMEHNRGASPSRRSVCSRTSVGSSAFSREHHSSAPATEVVHNMNLPPCDMEIFKGDFLSWPTFRDLFTALYIRNSRLSDIERLCHLLNKTSGDARDIVAKFPLTNSSFAFAWQELRSTYENTRILVNEQLRKLFGLTNLEQESSAGLKALQRGVNSCLSAMTIYGISTESWDPILVFLCVQRLPRNTITLWEQSIRDKTAISLWKDLDNFLSERIQTLDCLRGIMGNTAKRQNEGRIKTHFSNARSSKIPATHSNKGSMANNSHQMPKACVLCPKYNHSLRSCYRFQKLSVNERIAQVQRHHCCLNCLSRSHELKDCTSKFLCSICNKRHHSMLHRDVQSSSETSRAKNNSTSVITSSSQTNMSSNDVSQQSTSRGQTSSSACNRQVFHASQSLNVLLGTAIVNIVHQGVAYPARALIDPGSEASFITERLQRQLRLSTSRANARIAGVNQAVSASTSKLCELRIGSPIDRNLELKTGAFVLPSISGNLPSVRVSPDFAAKLPNIKLADSRFFDCRPVDVLLGADIYPRLISGESQRVADSLLAQSTVFGWIITGPIPLAEIRTFTTTVNHLEEDDLNKTLLRFWEIEEIPRRKILSPSDKFCEDFYKRTTYRDSEGRYVVSLPLVSEDPELGESRGNVLAQFYRNESSLIRKPEIKSVYDEVVLEYLAKGHMGLVPSPVTGDTSACYLPHHPVIKPDKLTTKLRVVFNASNKTSNGKSLNDILHTGPTLQQDLCMLILRWRLFRYVFNCDITQMYRQIRVDPAHTKYQTVLYRECREKPVQDYELLTVTFGVNCAPYLAIRTLLDLADVVEKEFPEASKIIRRSMYVDDVLAGFHDVESAITARDQLIAALTSAKFELRKWTSNHIDILSVFPTEFLVNAQLLEFIEASGSKPLGIRWNAHSDSFYFDVSPLPQKLRHTKREVLSVIAKLFDPLGWLGPVIITAKMIMQRIWKDNIPWDHYLVPATEQEWQKFVRSYTDVNSIKIPRWVSYSPEIIADLHVFSDASEKAYAGVIYIRIETPNGDISTSLLSCKTKVAPLKSISLPRLELSGAVLASELLKSTREEVGVEIQNVYCWTDSTIVLSWIRKAPATWTTFVANRVSRIQENVRQASWYHVRSEDNPADLGSRGATPEELASSDLWWHGPRWLRSDRTLWNVQQFSSLDTDLELRSVKTHITFFDNYEDIMERFSSLPRAMRVIAYIFRFFHLTHRVHRGQYFYESSAITGEEIKAVKLRLAIVAQKAFYPVEYQCLLDGKPLDPKSPLASVNPRLDNEGLMRLNGRLVKSPCLRYSEQYPIILPYHSRFTLLLLEYMHLLSIHGGNQLMLRIARIEYWIPRLKTLIRSVVYQCKICVLDRKRSCNQIMAALPSERTTIDRPFSATGIDFAGPFDIKVSAGRSTKCTKGYVCVFVCFATKAVHLEASSDLSTDAFMAAFHRFIARRGCPRSIFSDNGTNFVGAAREMERDFKIVLQNCRLRVDSDPSYQCLSWSFIPAGAPHMGGLWEAAVKSFKIHFRKQAQGLKYTFEEFSTILTRIEACLNSRPLTPMSENPCEIAALTPGHFLIGAPILAPPEPTLDNHPLDLVNRYRKLKALSHQFCSRWKEEYLHSLHKRYKWKFPQRDIAVDDLVVIRHEREPPTSWRLGRVIKIYPGSDGHVRVADIRTENGVATRPVTKLVVLP